MTTSAEVGLAQVYRGHIFHIAGAGLVQEADSNLVSIHDGGLVVGDAGEIVWVGDFASLPQQFVQLPVTRSPFIIPGFVDAHVHFPQTYSVAAYGGGQLLEWLERCIFPAEARLANPEFAQQVAADFCAQRVRTGTTAAMVFGSAFPVAQDALFQTSLDSGLRTVSGRGIQVVGPEAAAPLITSEEAAIELAAAEVSDWHGTDTIDVAARDALVQVALVPRFSLSTTTKTLAALGKLYDEVRSDGVYFHTHLSENNRPGTGEIDAVKSLYQVDNYLDTYDGKFLPGSRTGGLSLLGRRSIFAHAVHCTDHELAQLSSTESSIAHCPVSQQFLGSGTMPWRRTVAAGVNVAMGTDVGAGDEWLIARTLAVSYGVHLSEPGDDAIALTPAELLFSGTLAGARALDQEHLFGNFDIGKQADMLLIDPDAVPALALTIDQGIRAADVETADQQTLFALLFGLREPAITGVVVRGRSVSAP